MSELKYVTFKTERDYVHNIGIVINRNGDTARVLAVSDGDHPAEIEVFNVPVSNLNTMQSKMELYFPIGGGKVKYYDINGILLEGDNRPDLDTQVLATLKKCTKNPPKCWCEPATKLVMDLIEDERAATGGAKSSRKKSKRRKSLKRKSIKRKSIKRKSNKRRKSNRRKSSRKKSSRRRRRR